MLTRPEPGEKLLMYLTVSQSAVSSVLVREEDGHQKPVYYVSQVLSGAEARYLVIEKITYAVVVSARKLRPYFQAHTVNVLTDQPLRQALSKPNAAGRLAKWAVELSEFDIYYSLRPAIKAQVLADFVTECSVADRDGRDSAEAGEPQFWTLHIDGSSTAARSGAGLILSNPNGAIWKYALRFGFRASNNEVEYEALIAGLKLASEIVASNVRAFSDSQLVVNQLKGEYKAKEPAMVWYLNKTRDVIMTLGKFEINRIPRDENAEADALAKLASSDFTDLKGSIYVKILPSPSTEMEPRSVLPAEEPSWMDLIVGFVRVGKLPESAKEARKVIRRSAKYSWIVGKLY